MNFHGAVDLERAGKDHIGQGQARTPERLERLFDAFAQFSEQREKAILLVALCAIVGSPFLFVGLLDRNRLGEGFGLGLFVVSEFALGHNLNRVNVFAPKLSGCEIRTSAMRMREIGLDGVVRSALACLGRDKPSVAVVAGVVYQANNR